MGEALGLLGFSIASALAPVFNLEVYVVLLAERSPSSQYIVLGFIAGLGQMLGKLVWYYLGANALRWGWIRKKVEKPKAQAKLEHWRARTQDRPLLGAALVAVSGFSGFPPFAIIAVLAGQLRMNLTIFLVVTVLSRWVRFALFFYLGEQAFAHLPHLGF